MAAQRKAAQQAAEQQAQAQAQAELEQKRAERQARVCVLVSLTSTVQSSSILMPCYSACVLME